MIKKTALFVSESYAVQKQREEVVGRLHIFLVDYLWPKIQISFVKVTEILMYFTIFHFKVGLTQALLAYLSLTLLIVVQNLSFRNHNLWERRCKVSNNLDHKLEEGTFAKTAYPLMTNRKAWRLSGAIDGDRELDHLI